jgi:hypothetical protein
MSLEHKWMELEIIMLYIPSKSGSEGQRSHIFPHIWKLNLKDKCINTYICVCMYEGRIIKYTESC